MRGKKEIIGILLLCVEPIIHNLHNIAIATKTNKMPIIFYQELYYFLFAFLHSFAPLIALAGCFLVKSKQAKYFIIIPASYQLYKSLEKIPLRQNYSIYDEFITLSLLFVASFGLLIWYFTSFDKQEIKLTSQEEKQAENNLESLKKTLNLK